MCAFVQYVHSDSSESLLLWRLSCTAAATASNFTGTKIGSLRSESVSNRSPSESRCWNWEKHTLKIFQIRTMPKRYIDSYFCEYSHFIIHYYIYKIFNIISHPLINYNKNHSSIPHSSCIVFAMFSRKETQWGKLWTSKCWNKRKNMASHIEPF